jgi:hypothetical protein
MKLQVAFNTLVSKQDADDFSLALALPAAPTTAPIPSPTASQDTYICTSDLGVYQVHFPILACASPMFVALLTPRGPGFGPKFYDIADDSASFCCFLGLVYSRDLPSISTYSGLDYALAVARKYGLMLSAKLLRGLLSDPQSLVYVDNDPWSAFLVAQRWEFVAEMNMASRKLVGQVDLTDDSILARLQASESGIRILSCLVTRQTKLATRLFSSPLSEPSTPLVCFSCPDTVLNWITVWAQNLYKALTASGETPELFGLASALEVVECDECRQVIIRNARAVEAWMRSVRDDLKSDGVL